MATAPSTLATILVVEDDSDIRASVREVLQDDGIPAVGAYSLEEARRYLATTSIAGVVLDYQLPDGTGAELLHELSLRVVSPGVVLASAHPEAFRVARYFGVAFIDKPFDLEVLLAAVRVLLDGRGRPAAARRPPPTVKLAK